MSFNLITDRLFRARRQPSLIPLLTPAYLSCWCLSSLGWEKQIKVIPFFTDTYSPKLHGKQDKPISSRFSALIMPLSFYTPSRFRVASCHPHPDDPPLRSDRLSLSLPMNCVTSGKSEIASWFPSKNLMRFRRERKGKLSMKWPQVSSEPRASA